MCGIRYQKKQKHIKKNSCPLGRLGFVLRRQFMHFIYLPRIVLQTKEGKYLREREREKKTKKIKLRGIDSHIEKEEECMEMKVGEVPSISGTK